MKEIKELITEITCFTDIINQCNNPSGPDAINACHLFRNYLWEQLSDIAQQKSITPEKTLFIKSIMDVPNTQWTEWVSNLNHTAHSYIQSA